MPTAAATFDLIARVTDASVDRALAAALPTADPQDQPRLAALLLRRHNPEAVTALVAHWDGLDPVVRRWVVEHAGELHRPIREVARREDPRAAANALDLIRLGHQAELAYVVSERLRHGDPALRELAARTLRDMAAELCQTPPDRQRDARGLAFLHAAIDEAIRLYRHHEQPAVVEALLALLPRPTGSLAELVRDRRSPFAAVLQSALRQPRDAEARAALLPLAGVAPLGAAAMAGVGAAARGGHWADLLAHGHLLLLPAVRRQIASLRDPDTLAPAEDAVPELPADRLRHLPRWLTCLPIDLDGQVQRLVPLCRAGDAMARLAALRELIALTRCEPRRDLGSALAAFCHDPEESIAAVALRELIRRKWDGLPRLLSELVNAPHARVREIAGRRLAPLGFEKLWQRWPQLTRTQRLAAGRALLKLDPRFHEAIGRRLASREPDAVVRALSIITDLGQGAFFEPALLQLSRHPDAKVASAAVHAMGSAESPQAQAALEAALNHADPRVRANAVEAMKEHQCVRQVQRLARMAEGDANRPRANAIRSLMELNAGDAMSALSRMLADARPQHRRSALWLVETLGLAEVGRHVAELAVADPEPAIRRRAADVMQDLIAAMQPEAAPPSSPPRASSAPVSAVAAAILTMAALLPAVAQAQSDAPTFRLKDIGDHFGSESMISVWWIAVATGALILLIGLLSLRNLRERAASRSAPMLVFRRVAQHAGVDLADQWLLVRIARQQRLPTPLTLLLSAGTLMHHGAAYAASLRPRPRRTALLRLEALLRTYYGTPSTEPLDAADHTDARRVA